MHKTGPKSGHNIHRGMNMEYRNTEPLKKEMAAYAATQPYRFSFLEMMGNVQQYLLYAASGDALFDGKTNDERDLMPKESLETLQAIVRKVQRSQYAATHWPRFYNGLDIVVDNDVSLAQTPGGKKYGGAFTDTKEVAFGTGPARIHLSDTGFAMQEAVVLHELGHAIEAYERPDSNFDRYANGHGPEFARLNLEIVREFMSPERAKKLEEAFRFAGVQVAPESSHSHIAYGGAV